MKISFLPAIKFREGTDTQNNEDNDDIFNMENGFAARGKEEERVNVHV